MDLESLNFKSMSSKFGHFCEYKATQSVLKFSLLAFEGLKLLKGPSGGLKVLEGLGPGRRVWAKRPKKAVDPFQ